jgi:hypothetical protein
MLPPVPANAQTAIRTYVSITGNDTNPCSLTAPCRHFQAAVNATSVGGEVDALDPGGYGSFTINQAVTIEGEGWSYVAPPASNAAITINAGSGNVVLRGLSLNGAGAADASGIVFNSGGGLSVRDCIIRNFSDPLRAVFFTPNSSGKSQLYMSNTLVSDNTGDGINIQPSGSGTTNVVFDHVEMLNNAGAGLDAGTGSQTINITINDSVSSDNTDSGILASSTGGTMVSIMVRNSTIANNSFGLAASGSGAIIRLTRSTIAGNNVGWSNSGGVVESYADNNIDGNGTDNTAPPCVNGTSPCTAYK